jgi:hypothetical protein
MALRYEAWIICLDRSRGYCVMMDPLGLPSWNHVVWLPGCNSSGSGIMLRTSNWPFEAPFEAPSEGHTSSLMLPLRAAPCARAACCQVQHEELPRSGEAPPAEHPAAGAEAHRE